MELFFGLPFLGESAILKLHFKKLFPACQQYISRKKDQQTVIQRLWENCKGFYKNLKIDIVKRP